MVGCSAENGMFRVTLGHPGSIGFQLRPPSMHTAQTCGSYWYSDTTIIASSVLVFCTDIELAAHRTGISNVVVLDVCPATIRHGYIFE